jgi:hypothetical protein
MYKYALRIEKLPENSKNVNTSKNTKQNFTFALTFEVSVIRNE